MKAQDQRNSVRVGDVRCNHSLEELERRCLFSCTGDAGEYDQVESELTLSSNGSTSPYATLTIGIGQHLSARVGNETVVTGLGQTEFTSVATLPLDDGRYVIVWAGDHLGTYGVHLRVFSSNGAPLGNPQLVAEFPWSISETIDLSVSSTSGGEFVVLWRQGQTILGQRFDCNMRPLGSQQPVVSDANEFQSGLQSISRHGNGIILVWSDFQGNVLAQAFDENLLPTHARIWLPIAVGNEHMFQLLRHPTSDFAISYFEQSGFTQYVERYSLEAAGTSTVVLENEFADVRPILIDKDGRILSLRPASDRITDVVNVVLEIHDAGGDLLFQQTVLEAVATEQIPQLVSLDHGGFAVSFTRHTESTQQLFVQQFNAEAQLVGEELPINSGPIPHPATHLLTPLSGNGFAVQWMGYALNGSGVTLDTRHYQIGVTPLTIDNVITVDPTSRVLVHGLPLQVSLNKGNRDPEGTWHLDIADLDDLVVLSEEPLSLLQITVSVIQSTTLEELETLQGSIGTADNDWIPSVEHSVVNGGPGIDTLVVNRAQSDVLAIATAEGFQLQSWLGPVIHPNVVGVEYVQFSSGLISFDELLNPITEEPPTTEEPAETHDEDSPADDETEDAETSSEDNWIDDSNYQDADEPSDDAPIFYLDRSDLSWEPTDSSLSQEWLDEWVEEWDDYLETDSLSNAEAEEEANAYAGEESMAAVASDTPIDLEDTPIASADPIVGLPEEEIERTLGKPKSSAAKFPVAAMAQPATPWAISQPHVRPMPMRAKTSVHQLPKWKPSIVVDLATLELPSGEDGEDSVELFSSNELGGIKTVFDSDLLFSIIDSEEATLSETTQQLVVGTSVVFAAGFSLAYVIWALRATMLMTKVMSTLPVWVGFDPLPMLESLTADDEETLLDIVAAKLR